MYSRRLYSGMVKYLKILEKNPSIFEVLSRNHKNITATSKVSMAISKAVIMYRDPKARQADEACVLITMAPLAVNMTAPAARMGSSTFFASFLPLWANESGDDQQGGWKEEGRESPCPNPVY